MKNWDEVSNEELDDEFYRMLDTMPKTDLIDVVLGLVTWETKLDFVKQWHDGDENDPQD